MSSTPLRVVTEPAQFKSGEASYEQVSRKQRPLPPWLIPLLVAGALTFAIVGFALGSDSPASDKVKETAQIDDFLAKGKTTIAVSLIESALTQNPAPSAQAKAGLVRRWYSASMDDLVTAPGLEESAGTQIKLKWLAIEKKADGYGVPKTERLAPKTVASRAYSAGLWALSDTAFRRAWEAGEIGIESAGFRYALLRNWGYQLTFRGSPETQQQGAWILATAHAIARAYNLQNGEACRDLQTLGYADCNQVAWDLTEPVLVDKKVGG